MKATTEPGASAVTAAHLHELAQRRILAQRRMHLELLALYFEHTGKVFGSLNYRALDAGERSCIRNGLANLLADFDARCSAHFVDAREAFLDFPFAGSAQPSTEECK